MGNSTGFSENLKRVVDGDRPVAFEALEQIEEGVDYQALVGAGYADDKRRAIELDLDPFPVEDGDELLAPEATQYKGLLFGIITCYIERLILIDQIADEEVDGCDALAGRLSFFADTEPIECLVGRFYDIVEHFHVVDNFKCLGGLVQSG